MEEKRLIDANSILDEFLKRYTEMERDGNLIFSACEIKQDFADMISNAATVDTVEVKCKVGDFVYALWEAPVKLKYIIYCAEVKEIRISMINCRLTTTYRLEPIEYRGHTREYRDVDFGTSVFKDEEDAERKLYPCERCISETYHSCEGCSYGKRKDDDK